jgi:hypothetical protein
LHVELRNALGEHSWRDIDARIMDAQCSNGIVTYHLASPL